MNGHRPWASTLLVLTLALAAARPVAAGGTGEDMDCVARMGEIARALTLAPPEDLAPDEAPRLRVAGVLASGDRLVVAGPEGQHVGGLVPFGAVGETRVSGSMSLPPELKGTGPVTLHIWVETAEGRCRPPSDDELRTVEFIAIEVTR